MTRLQEELLMECQTFGIDIELDFIVSLKGGKRVQTSALIPSLGGPRGMLVVNSYNAVSSVWDDVIEEGYGIAVLDEPSENYKFNLDASREMFIDWGWSGEGLNVKNEEGIDMHP